MAELITESCPVCADGIGPERVLCPRCETPHHGECWEYVGDCAIFGCKDAATLPVPERRARITAIQVLVSSWVWTFRIQWWAFLVMVSCASTIGLMMLTAPVSFFLLPIVLLVIAATVPVYLLCLVPLWLTQGRMEALAGPGSGGPRKGARDLADRLELSSEHGTMAGFVDGLPDLYLTFSKLGLAYSCIAAVVVFGWSMIETVLPAMVPAAMFWAMGYALIQGIREATRARVSFLTSIQNRVLSSAKAVERLPG